MMLHRIGPRLAVVGSLLLPSACAVYTRPGAEPEPPAPVVTPTPEPIPPAPTPLPDVPRGREDAGVVAAYSPLLAKAETAASQGDYEQALALLERAQRIAPDSAAVYLAMAGTYARKGDKARASATAERGLLYCGGGAVCEELRSYIR
ncbi:MAG: tetratricopeptide repeat protein [Halioglobus sp.]